MGCISLNRHTKTRFKNEFFTCKCRVGIHTIIQAKACLNSLIQCLQVCPIGAIIVTRQRLSQKNSSKQRFSRNPSIIQIPDRTQTKTSCRPLDPWEKMPAHIMLSYQWDDQPLVKRIHERLTEHGLPVWMDIEGGVTGNINDA